MSKFGFRRSKHLRHRDTELRVGIRRFRTDTRLCRRAKEKKLAKKKPAERHGNTNQEPGAETPEETDQGCGAERRGNTDRLADADSKAADSVTSSLPPQDPRPNSPASELLCIHAGLVPHTLGSLILGGDAADAQGDCKLTSPSSWRGASIDWASKFASFAIC